MAELTHGVYSRMDLVERDDYLGARRELAKRERGLAELRVDVSRYKHKSDIIEKLIPFQERQVDRAYERLTSLIAKLNEKYEKEMAEGRPAWGEGR